MRPPAHTELVQKWVDKYRGLFYLILGSSAFSSLRRSPSVSRCITALPMRHNKGRHQLCWSGQLHYRISHQKIAKALMRHLQVRAITVPLKLIFALFIAYILNFKIACVRPVRTVYYIPLHSGRLCGYRRAVGCVQRGRSAEHRGARCHLWCGAGPRMAV